MIPKSIHEITFDDLNALVGLVREGKMIEFKREMQAKTRDEGIKFLAAVSSFANTGGGDLLIGIEARAGLATAIPGVAFPDLDAEKLRLLQLLANGLEPRLPRIDIEAIACGRSRHVLVIRAQQSWLAPHKVKVNDKFYGRNSGGKYPLDVSELRTAFVLSDSVIERMRNFTNNRLIKIAGGEASVSLFDRPAMIIHVVPFSTYGAGRTIDVVEAAMKGCYLRDTAELGGTWYDRGPLKVDTIALPEVAISSDPADVPQTLRPHFNTVWNGFGEPGSPKYNQRGEWIGTA
jgi:hypothetical protein